jgi:hypothetical protein
MPEGVPMTAGGMVLMCLLGMYFVAMLILSYCTRGYRTEYTPRREVPFVLREGQTIIGVVDTKQGMKFYLGNHVRDEKSYE